MPRGGPEAQRGRTPKGLRPAQHSPEARCPWGGAVSARARPSPWVSPGGKPLAVCRPTPASRPWCLPLTAGWAPRRPCPCSRSPAGSAHARGGSPPSWVGGNQAAAPLRDALGRRRCSRCRPGIGLPRSTRTPRELQPLAPSPPAVQWAAGVPGGRETCALGAERAVRGESGAGAAEKAATGGGSRDSARRNRGCWESGGLGKGRLERGV